VLSRGIWPSSTMRPFGAVSEVTLAPSDPAIRWTTRITGQPSSYYSANCLIEASTAIRQAEILATERVLGRSMESFDLFPTSLIGDAAKPTAKILNWLVDIADQAALPVCDKSQSHDGTLAREGFAYKLG
jgi:hypothetical protein